MVDNGTFMHKDLNVLEVRQAVINEIVENAYIMAESSQEFIYLCTTSAKYLIAPMTDNEFISLGIMMGVYVANHSTLKTVTNE